MIINHRNILTLDSMGVTLDNIGAPTGSLPVIYVPDDGSVVFVPSSGVIRRYAATATGTTSTDEAPDVHALYLNAISQRLYSWNGTAMMELMDTTDGLGQFTDATSFNEPDKVYHVLTARQLTAALEIGAGSTVVFHGAGKFSGAAITGTNIQFIADGENVCFGPGCTFANLTPRSSWLQATNFGAVSDMATGSPHSWTFMGLTCDIQERSGTNNYNVWQMIGSFLNNSTDIKLEFNGEFYSQHPSNQDLAIGNDLNVSNGNNLELYGGVVLFGLYLYDCNHVHVHHMRYVGFHLVHDFPTVCNNKSQHPEWANISYAVSDGLSPCGLAGDGIQARRYNLSRSCDDIHIEFCRIEMRQNGTCGNSKVINGTFAEVTNFNVNDCSFDHIYFQPVASHCSHSTFERIVSNYCLQGVDISTYANHTTVRDSIFLNCACGPKQDTINSSRAYSHDNILENCLFDMNDSYNLINASHFALSANFGPANDTFVIRNSNFIVNSESAEYYYPIVCRCPVMFIENCHFHLDIHPASNVLSKAIIATGGSMQNLDYTPLIKFKQCVINNLTFASYLCANYSSLDIGVVMESTQLKSVQCDIGLNHCTSISIDSCVLDLSTKTFIKDTSNVQISNSVLFNESQMLGIRFTASASLNVSLQDNVIKHCTKVMQVESVSTTGTINIEDNVINCNTFVVVPAACAVSITQSGNVINIIP